MHNLSQKLLNYSTDKVGLSACVNEKKKKKRSDMVKNVQPKEHATRSNHNYNKF